MKKLGVIVNPVAGLGGRMGLKGSDGARIQAEAIKLGAVAEAPAHMIEALAQLYDALETLSAFPGQIDVCPVKLVLMIVIRTRYLDCNAGRHCLW